MLPRENFLEDVIYWNLMELVLVAEIANCSEW